MHYLFYDWQFCKEWGSVSATKCLVCLDYSRDFYSALVYYSDSPGHRAWNHRYQRSGGRSGKIWSLEDMRG